MAVTVVVGNGSVGATLGSGTVGISARTGNSLTLPFVYVDDYGAQGDGVTDDATAINSAITAAGENGTIVLGQNKTYLIDDSLQMLSSQILLGQGSTIKRSDEAKTTTTEAVLDQATSFNVSDASVFEVGQFIRILDGTGTYLGKGDEEISNQLTISDITGNTITVSEPIDLPTSGNLDGAGEYPSASVVLRFFSMVNPVNETSTDAFKPLHFDNVVFDGNSANNDSCYAWTGDRVIAFMGAGSTVTKCMFKDISREGIFPSRDCLIDGNIFENINGSAIHISNSTISGDDSQTYGRNRIVNNIFKNTLLEKEANGRAGVITNSANSQKTFIANNQCDTSAGMFYGTGSSTTITDYELFLVGNKVKNTIGIAETTGNNIAINSKHVITGNVFENCEWLFFNDSTNGHIEDGFGLNKITIGGNVFVNVKLFFESVSNAVINNNTFTNEEGHDYSTNANPGFNFRGDAVIAFSDCINITVNGNSFEDESTTLNTLLEAAVICEIATLPIKIKSDASTNTEYTYSRNINMTNNIFSGFATSIADWGVETLGGFEPDIEGRVFAWQGFNFKGNTIYMRNNSDSRWGILAGPGCQVVNNTIYGDSNAAAGIRALGANDATGSEYSGTIFNNVNGAIVLSNIIYGCNPSIEVGNTFNAIHGANNYNCEIRDNITTHAITDRTSGNSNVTGNITTNVSESPIIKKPREDSNFY